MAANTPPDAGGAGGREAGKIARRATTATPKFGIIYGVSSGCVCAKAKTRRKMPEFAKNITDEVIAA
jgi:hypothetical protein